MQTPAHAETFTHTHKHIHISVHASIGTQMLIDQDACFSTQAVLCYINEVLNYACAFSNV